MHPYMNQWLTRLAVELGGPGYRVFLSRQGPVLVLLLCGSDKGEQDKAIKLTLTYLADWKQRGET